MIVALLLAAVEASPAPSPAGEPGFFTADMIAALSTICIAFAGIIVTYLKLFQARLQTQMQEVHKTLTGVSTDVSSVKEQTNNDHGTNLRDDLDALGAKLDIVAEKVEIIARRQESQGQELTSHGAILNQLQTSQQQDRTERIALDSRAHDEHHRMWQELDRLKNRERGE